MSVKYVFCSLAVAVVIQSWCSPGFAQQVINGATPTALSATGVTAGVAMTGQGGGGTLIVGTIGGPEADIFTNNSSGGTVTNPLLKAVSTDTSSSSSIVFNNSSTVFGALGVTNPGGPFFLNINGGNNGTAVNFDGGLFGTITTVSGTGSLNFNNGATNITATNFAANGTISLAPNTTLIGALTTSAANSGTLVLGGGSALTGAAGGATGLKAINVVGGSNAAGVSASISGAVDAFAFSLGTNTLKIGGALTVANQTPAGVINTTLASTTVYGNIQSTGAVNLGPSLLVNVAVPATAFFPVGTQFTIVKAPSGTNGSVVTVVNDPTNPLFTFSAVPVAGTVAGQVIIATTGIPLTVPVTPPPGSRSRPPWSLPPQSCLPSWPLPAPRLRPLIFSARSCLPSMRSPIPPRSSMRWRSWRLRIRISPRRRLPLREPAHFKISFRLTKTKAPVTAVPARPMTSAGAMTRASPMMGVRRARPATNMTACGAKLSDISAIRAPKALSRDMIPEFLAR
jgi:hypothetical protein